MSSAGIRQPTDERRTCRVPNLLWLVSQAYEHRIWHGGSFVDHADPYAYRWELRPDHRSIVSDLFYERHGAEWMAARADGRGRTMNVHELHLDGRRMRSGDEPAEAGGGAG